MDHHAPSSQVLAAKLRPPRAVGQHRERLEHRLADIWEGRVGVVAAAAGSGKSTLLAQFVESTGVPTAWCRAEASEATVHSLLAHLERAAVDAIGVEGGWQTVEDVAASLDRWSGPRALIVIDDLHALAGTSAEAALERLASILPPHVRLLLASRQIPAFNLTRWRLNGDAVELGDDDLRFRPWEIEHLFRDHYDEPLSTSELMALTRRTDGWAAALQLFHLATMGKGVTSRRRLLSEMGLRSSWVREYLHQNVFAELPEPLGRFLIDTSVLGVVCASLCDQFLSRGGSAEILEELERRNLFVQVGADDGTLRYHEVWRSFLEGLLLDQRGEDGVRAECRRAADLLEAHGHAAAAIRAWCRADEWPRVHAILGRQESTVDRAGVSDWLDFVPPALVEGDAWLQLATARRHRRGGRIRAALDAYERAADGLEGGHAEACLAERIALSMWAEPLPPPGAGWLAIVRRAVQRNPLHCAHEAELVPGAEGRLATGLCLLLAGQLGPARLVLEALDEENPDPLLSVGVSTAIALTRFLTGSEMSRLSFDDLATLWQGLDVPWAARIARAVAAAASPDTLGQVREIAAECRRDRDEWGAALVNLIHGVGALLAGHSQAGPVEEAAEAFRRIGAGTLECWSRGVLALTLTELDDPQAHSEAEAAEAMARKAGVRAAQSMALEALARCEPDRGLDRRESARLLDDECGLDFARLARGRRVTETDTPAPTGTPFATTDPSRVPRAEAGGIEVYCFGGLAVWRDGRQLDLRTVRPRARLVLQMLALRAGQAIHWEVLADALWPNADPRTAARNLHVAVSSLRHLLQTGAERPGAAVLVRADDAYRLVVEHCDVIDFDRAMAEALRARSEHDTATEVNTLSMGLQIYREDLFPEAGPAQWVVEIRRQYRADAATAAERLTVLHAGAGQRDAALASARRGLLLDPYRDRLWHLTIDLLGSGGDTAGAARARRHYDSVLRCLGDDDLSWVPSPISSS